MDVILFLSIGSLQLARLGGVQQRKRSEFGRPQGNTIGPKKVFLPSDTIPTSTSPAVQEVMPLDSIPQLAVCLDGEEDLFLENHL